MHVFARQFTAEFAHDQPRPSPRLAPRLGSTLGRVAHHVRVLRDIGLIELVETRRRRGAIEHIYTVPSVPRFSDGAWEGLGAAGRRHFLAASLEQIGDYVAGSAAAGGFDRPDANLSRVALRLDEQGWSELAAAGKRWLAEADGVQARAHERARAGVDGTRDVGLVLLVFDALAFSDRR